MQGCAGVRILVGPIDRGFDKAIVLIRDPLMAALSDFHRTKSGSNRHTSLAAMEQFQDNKWKNFAIQSVKKWRKFHDLMIRVLYDRNFKFVQ